MSGEGNRFDGLTLGEIASEIAYLADGVPGDDGAKLREIADVLDATKLPVPSLGVVDEIDLARGLLGHAINLTGIHEATPLLTDARARLEATLRHLREAPAPAAGADALASAVAVWIDELNKVNATIGDALQGMNAQPLREAQAKLTAVTKLIQSAGAVAKPLPTATPDALSYVPIRIGHRSEVDVELSLMHHIGDLVDQQRITTGAVARLARWLTDRHGDF